MVQKVKSIRPFLFGYLFVALLLAALVVGFEQGDVVLLMGHYRTDFLDALFKFWTLLGEEIFYAIVIITILFRRVNDGLMALATVPFIMSIIFLLKSFFAHPRPKIYFDQIGKLTDFNSVEGVHLLGGLTSFPSGHTAAGFAIGTLLALTFKSTILQCCFLFISTGVGVSRMYLGHHFPKDVLFGSFLGICIVLGTHLILSRTKLNQSRFEVGLLDFFNKKNRV